VRHDTTATDESYLDTKIHGNGYDWFQALFQDDDYNWIPLAKRRLKEAAAKQPSKVTSTKVAGKSTESNVVKEPQKKKPLPPAGLTIEDKDDIQVESLPDYHLWETTPPSMSCIVFGRLPLLGMVTDLVKIHPNTAEKSPRALLQQKKARKSAQLLSFACVCGVSLDLAMEFGCRSLTIYDVVGLL